MPALSRTFALLALCCLTEPPTQPASRSKTFLQEHCQKVRIALPEYSLTGTDGLAHRSKFQAMVMVANDTYTGTWQRSIKAAEGSAAEMACAQSLPTVSRFRALRKIAPKIGQSL